MSRPKVRAGDDVTGAINRRNHSGLVVRFGPGEEIPLPHCRQLTGKLAVTFQFERVRGGLFSAFLNIGEEHRPATGALQFLQTYILFR